MGEQDDGELPKETLLGPAVSSGTKDQKRAGIEKEKGMDKEISEDSRKGPGKKAASFSCDLERHHQKADSWV